MLAIKTIFRWFLFLIGLIAIVILIASAFLRFVVYPNIDQYKERIANDVSKIVGQKVTIGRIDTSWDGISPQVSFYQVDLFDKENRPALQLGHIDATISWLSIPLLQPRLSELIVYQPELIIRRKADGIIYLAGISLSGESHPEFANWLLSQSEILINNASLIWIDEQRNAPELALNKLNLVLENPTWRSLFGRHQFHLRATPSVGTAQAVNIHGDFLGNDISQLANWRGNINIEASQADLTAWRPWIDYPFEIQSGLGDTQLSLHFEKAMIQSVKADLTLKKLSATLKPQQAPVLASLFSGHLEWSKTDTITRFIAKNITLKSDNGLNIDAASGHLYQSTQNQKPWIDAELQLKQFNLASISALQTIFPLPTEFKNKVTAIAPRGELSNLNLNWVGATDNPTRYLVKSQFKGIGMNAYAQIPGVENITGLVSANESGGEVVLDSSNARLDLKGILRFPIPSNTLKGKITWDTNHNEPIVKTTDFFVANPHISGTVTGSYATNAATGGYINLQGNFGKGNVKYASFYYPIILGKDTLHWLDTSILSGNAEDVLLTIKGNAKDFPYTTKQGQLDPKLGTFKVTAKLSNILLEYGTGWPTIQGLGLDMMFEGTRMELNANKGIISGNNITKAKAVIPKLDADDPVLSIVGELEGKVVDGVKFVNQSPVKEVAMGFTDDLKTAGNAKLALDLSIPLQHSLDSKYKGEYKISNGLIYANPDVNLPELSKINGSLKFNDQGISAQNVATELYGGPAKLTLSSSTDKSIHIAASGRISDAGIKKAMPSAFSNALQGSTDWTGNINIKKPLVNLAIQSNLLGMAVNLPAPLNKAAGQAIALSIDKKQQTPQVNLTSISYGNLINANLIHLDKGGKAVLDRGNIGVNMPATQPNQAGLNVNGKLDTLNLDEWIAFLNKQSGKSDSNSVNVNTANFSIQNLEVFGRQINGLKLVAKPRESGLQVALDSDEVAGDLLWQSGANAGDSGKLTAKLKHLIIPNLEPSSKLSKTVRTDYRRLDVRYPALDITADDFQLGNKNLGTLELIAYENDDDWTMKKIKITNPDTTLLADGIWHNWSRSPNTIMNFSISIDNIGKTLKRFGQPDTIKSGVAAINGKLQWPGSPHEFESGTLNGNFVLGASKGQVLKVQPGVGRLLGLLSLQSLPRRLTLDFRDLFSDGFAFDSISATARIDKGVMRSDDFFMTGPAAETKIKGEINLQKETQNLRIKVRPHVSDSLSLAAFAGGPIAGVAAFVAQKLLKDPLNKIVQSEYVIAGTWDNPQEVKSEQDDKTNTSEQPNPLGGQ